MKVEVEDVPRRLPARLAVAGAAGRCRGRDQEASAPTCCWWAAASRTPSTGAALERAFGDTAGGGGPAGDAGASTTRSTLVADLDHGPARRWSAGSRTRRPSRRHAAQHRRPPLPRVRGPAAQRDGPAGAARQATAQYAAMGAAAGEVRPRARRSPARAGVAARPASCLPRSRRAATSARRRGAPSVVVRAAATPRSSRPGRPRRRCGALGGASGSLRASTGATTGEPRRRTARCCGSSRRRSPPGCGSPRRSRVRSAGGGARRRSRRRRRSTRRRRWTRSSSAFLERPGGGRPPRPRAALTSGSCGSGPRPG